MVWSVPEKLTTLFLTLNNQPLPIYGKGTNSREWIYVKDHCNALLTICRKGKIGESYNIGTNNNVNNHNLPKLLLKIIKNKKIKIGSKVRVKFVKDRPGHDFRYALNTKKIFKKFRWRSKIYFDEGLKETVIWYLKNKNFLQNISKKEYEKRLGLKL